MFSTAQNRRIKKFRNLLLILFGIYVMIGSALYFIQEQIMFHPTLLERDYQFNFSHPFEELFLETDDNAIINAVHFKNENPKGVILYFHGNAGDLSRWGLVVEYFVDLNYDVLIMDYRTYGKSTGRLTEEALYKDAQLCYDYLLKHYDASEITLYGRSLGTGIATFLASKNHPRQLILETPYYSITDVAQDRFPFLPVKYLLKYRIPTYKFIKDVNCPITIFHGTEDMIVPYKSAKKLYESLPEGKARFVTVEKCGHNNLIDFEGYTNCVQDILK